MKNLTADNLQGIWAGPPLFWDEKFQLDEKNTVENFQRICKIRPGGIYILGSSGEFYTLDFEEFKKIVNIFIETVLPFRIPTMIGCGATNTFETIRRMQYSWEKGAKGVQVVLPYWSELSDKEILKFFGDLYESSPDIPIIHYNIPRAKRFLTGEDYRKILEVCPTLIGVKFTFAGSYFGILQESIQLCPEISYLVTGESLLASAMQIGARGICSARIYQIPKITIRLFEKIKGGQWKEAITLQRKIAQFDLDLKKFLKANHLSIFDPAVDKGIALASGFLTGHPRVRPPYIGWSKEKVNIVKKWLFQNYSDFI